MPPAKDKNDAGHCARTHQHVPQIHLVQVRGLGTAAFLGTSIPPLFQMRERDATQGSSGHARGREQCGQSKTYPADRISSAGLDLIDIVEVQDVYGCSPLLTLHVIHLQGFPSQRRRRQGSGRLACAAHGCNAQSHWRRGYDLEHPPQGLCLFSLRLKKKSIL